ncbi:MAG: CoA transferase [Eubacteriales bacterium]|nr:CoA transferase [Eubacteriales bacterium]
MKPLEGIKVVELTTYFAAPMCGRVLADWGAEVIKIEGPKGDPYRVAYKGQGTPQFEEGCPSYDLENSNKKFVCLDGKSEEGRQAILRLIAGCDVFLTNNRPQAMKKMGLDYESIHSLYPDIVYAEILGYGEKGPLKDKPGYDYTVFFSRSGLMADLSPRGGQVMNTIAGFGDHAAAITLCSGVCAALLKAKLGRGGDHVSVSLYQAALFLLSNGLLCAEYGREFPRTHFDCNSPIMQCYRCRDGEWIFLAVPEYDRLWPVICDRVLEHPELAVDPRFCNIRETNKHRAEAVAALDEIFIQHDSDHWVKRLEKYDIAHEKLAHFKDVLKDEQAWANDYLQEYTYPGGEKTVMIGTPVTFASMKDIPFKHSGAVGCDTDEVLKRIGYTESEIAALKAAGAAK